MNRLMALLVAVWLSAFSGSLVPSFVTGAMGYDSPGVIAGDRDAAGRAEIRNTEEHASSMHRTVDDKREPLVLAVHPHKEEEQDDRALQSEREKEYMDQGFNQMAEKNYKNAIKAFETVLRYNPDHADAYAGLSLCYYKIGNTDVFTNNEFIEKAILYSEKAQSLGADYAETHFVLGMSHMVLGNFKAAIDEFDVLKRQDEELALQLVNRLIEYRPLSAIQHLETKGPPEDKPEPEAGKDAFKKKDAKPGEKGSGKKEIKKRRRFLPETHEDLL
jgi:tetratricopeptide (TPR) repeat protein